jgi:hypothetical protein
MGVCNANAPSSGAGEGSGEKEGIPSPLDPLEQAASSTAALNQQKVLSFLRHVKPIKN